VFGISRGDNGKFTVELKESTEYFDAIILATGSKADGHEFAQTLGHTIVKPVPSLFTLNTKHQVKEGGMLHGLSGISVPTARLTFKVDVERRKRNKSCFRRDRSWSPITAFRDQQRFAYPLSEPDSFIKPTTGEMFLFTGPQSWVLQRRLQPCYGTAKLLCPSERSRLLAHWC